MRDTQRKGDIALAQAISTFTRKGYDVALPLTESASYDLVVDNGKNLYRVQVKFTSRKQVDVRNIHSNSKGYVVKKAKDYDYDWLYILREENGNRLEYLFEECFVNRNSITPTNINLIN